ncbi:MAG: toxic anion resistance protein [Nocardioides sp.]|uniref:toxic anion resistance protein n=1 Tax=Nocardioides sp. TaxID=35761 RepID=UPI0039E5F1F0
MSETQPAGAVPGVDFAALLGDPARNPEPASPLETSLATVAPEDAAAATTEEATFSFRSLLSPQQLADLERSAPTVAAKMIGDYNAILGFGAPVLDRLNSTSTQLLEAQRDIKIPEAEVIVNDLLREIDGFNKKFRNEKLENAVGKLTRLIKGTAYSIKTLVRESKPIAEKIDLAEVKLREMELKLADNVTRGQTLHRNTLATLEDVVAVLAALEEIIEVSKARFAAADAALLAAGPAETPGDSFAGVTFEGRSMTVVELREVHAQLAGGITELEKTWFDWRQQFFLGYAQAPSVRNLILVSATMQRRCQVFRTMGLPAARSSLAMWQQAALAKEGAEMGDAVQKGVNELIQGAFSNAADAVEQVAKSAQAPVVSEETVFAIVDSVKRQCDGLLAADRWGREQRARNLAVLEAGERTIGTEFTESRRQLVQNAVAAVSGASPSAAPLPEADILEQLGVAK